jgi:hypothetical protein
MDRQCSKAPDRLQREQLLVLFLSLTQSDARAQAQVDTRQTGGDPCERVFACPATRGANGGERLRS